MIKSSLQPRGLANRAAIEDLDRLPETADELRIVAKALGNVRSTILLGSHATEHELRKQQLSNYHVISFATHALVAGGLDGLTEPALVLTPGNDAHNSKNDGLLTASEIGNLSLDANLVILSACNTAASDGHGGGRGLIPTARIDDSWLGFPSGISSDSLCERLDSRGGCDGGCD